VVFFGNVFDYVVGGAAAYGSIGPTRLGPGWKQIAGESPAGTEIGLWPGVYRSVQGSLVAVNADPASDVEIVAPKGAGGASGSALPVEVGWGAVFVLGALAMTLAALFYWSVRV
jgi:hypothetical protein